MLYIHTHHILWKIQRIRENNRMKDALFFSPLFSRYASKSIFVIIALPTYPDEMYLSIHTDSTNFAISKWSMLLPREVDFLASMWAQIPMQRSHYSSDWLNFFKFLRNFHFRLFHPSTLFSRFVTDSWCILSKLE